MTGTVSSRGYGRCNSASFEAQTVTLASEGDVLHFAGEATLPGVAARVRFNLMNVDQPPRDGKLVINERVRWVTGTS
jgi:hypothetical protein